VQLSKHGSIKNVEAAQALFLHPMAGRLLPGKADVPVPAQQTGIGLRQSGVLKPVQ
jgi:hypothetical protein